MNPFKSPALWVWLLFCAINLKGQPPVRQPLKLIDKLIVIEAKVNYRHSGYFVLDTGASQTTLNSKYFRGDLSPAGSVYGLHDEITSFERRRVDIEIGQQTWKAREVLILDLAHLEKISPVPYKILGLLGVDFFKNTELVIDFIEGYISFFPSPEDELGQAPPNPFDIILSFEEESGLPVIQTKIGEQLYRLGIDSGAGINILDERYREELSVFFGETGSSMTLDIGGYKKSLFVARLRGVHLDGMPLSEMLTQFQDLNWLNQQTVTGELDGLLGQEFLKQGKLRLDFAKKKLIFQFKNLQDAIRSAGVISSNADTSMLGPPGN